METKQKFRSKWIDPDFRRDPKTNSFCVVCQRDLKEGQAHRRVMYELDRYEAIHSDDWEIAEKDIPVRRQRYGADAVLVGEIGMDCAKRLGLEWSRP